jgi:hypothetical protein
MGSMFWRRDEAGAVRERGVENLHRVVGNGGSRAR